MCQNFEPQLLAAKLRRTQAYIVGHDKLRLINTYGPAECAIGVHTQLIVYGSDPANIGHQVGGCLWIADPANEHRLFPIGCIGELLIEGSTGRGGRTWERYNSDGTLNFICRKDTEVC
jgi:hypothetical protein